MLLLISLGISLGVNAQNVNIPDANFKAYLVGNSAINTNGDSEIQISEANAYTDQISCSNLSINDLMGLEEFTSIYRLNASDNNLTNVNLANNLQLTELVLSNNSLTSIDISQNVLLHTVAIDNNQLTSINTSSNPDLVNLACHNNQITGLFLSQNPNLYDFSCNGNQLTSLNLSANSQLYRVQANNNNLTSLDFSNNTSIEIIELNFNQIYALDLSLNTSLSKLKCADNNLTELNLSNGTNTLMNGASDMQAYNNPNLTCILVDDTTYSNNTWTWIDAQTSFNTNCVCTVNIPDANFKAYLLGQSTINTNGNTEIECTEANNVMGALNLNNLNIADLTGIEAFTSLFSLSFNNNQVTSLDLSQNLTLTSVVGVNNQLNTIILGNNQQLQSVYLQNNQLSSIDVSGLINLELLSLDDNLFTSIDVTTNTNLLTLTFSNNDLTNIDVSQNPLLEDFIMENNMISSLDLTNNLQLDNFKSINNPLISLFIDGIATFETFMVSGSMVDSIDLSFNPNLFQVHVNLNNNLSYLNLANGNNSAIQYFSAKNPNLPCIKVSDLVYANNNWINSIDSSSTFSLNCTLVKNPNGVKEFEYQLDIYPNPFNEVINISTNRNLKSIELLDLSGKKILESQDKTIDLSFISKGIYFIRLNNGKTIQTKKIIKQ